MSGFEEYPPSHQTTVEVVRYRDDDGIPNVHLEEILTDGDVEYGNSDDSVTAWEDLTEDQRDTWIEWLAAMHALRVRVAEQEPEVRKEFEKLAQADVWGKEWVDQPDEGNKLLDKILNRATKTAKRAAKAAEGSSR